MITFQSSNPKNLLALFDAAIEKDHAQGGIATREKIDGYYTHKAQQWSRLAYFKATITPAGLVFNIVKNNKHSVSTVAYGYYHGHLLETFLNHFDKQFTTASCSAVCLAGDVCSAAA